LVEDEDIVREILSKLLQENYPEIQIHSASSAEDGLELFRKHPQAIIITDINIAGSSGIKMVRSIREMDSDTIIIFITGCPDVVGLAGLLETASCHCICKPLDFKDLFALIDGYIHVSSASSEQDDEFSYSP
jgi:DNA-binding response OmpR family regulator